MKQTRILLFTAVCGAALAMTTIASADTDKAGYATIVRIEGEARYSLGDGNWHPLVAGKTLDAGAVIQTGHNGLVDMALGNKIEMPQARSAPDKISFAPDSNVRGLITYRPSVEQNMVRLTADTTLQIDKLTVSETGVDAVSDTELNLKNGHIFASVKKLSGASQYLIKIPNGIAGVRGTVLSVDADKGTVAVLESDSSGGSDVVLSIINADGSAVTYVIGPGNQYAPSNGGVIPIPLNLFNLLEKTVVPILKTPYLEIVSVSYTSDRTTVFVSTTVGVGGGSSSSGSGDGGDAGAPGDGDFSEILTP
jgi:hypothetical protein